MKNINRILFYFQIWPKSERPKWNAFSKNYATIKKFQRNKYLISICSDVREFRWKRYVFWKLFYWKSFLSHYVIMIFITFFRINTNYLKLKLLLRQYFSNIHKIYRTYNSIKLSQNYILLPTMKHRNVHWICSTSINICMCAFILFHSRLIRVSWKTPLHVTVLIDSNIVLCTKLYLAIFNLRVYFRGKLCCLKSMIFHNRFFPIFYCHI